MNEESHLFEVFIRETAPTSRSTQRAWQRLQEAGVLRDASLDLLAAAAPKTSVQPTKIAIPSHRRPRPMMRPAILVGITLAAVLLLVWQVLPSPPPLDTSLDSPAAWSSLVPVEALALSFQGTGHLGGTAREATIRWEAGTLELSLDPQRHMRLHIVTREGRVQVLGTVLAVTRDALGTSVRVERGHVELVCEGGASQLLATGQERACMPTTAAGLLGRARALQDGGAAPAEILVAAEAGLAHGEPGSAVQGELQVARLQALQTLGRRADALQVAEQYLDEHYALRHVQVLRLAAGLALELGGCEAALPHLGPLAAVTDQPTDLVYLADCLGPVSEARELLHRALDLDPEPDLAVQVQARLRALTTKGGNP